MSTVLEGKPPRCWTRLEILIVSEVIEHSKGDKKQVERAKLERVLQQLEAVRVSPQSRLRVEQVHRKIQEISLRERMRASVSGSGTTALDVERWVTNTNATVMKAQEGSSYSETAKGTSPASDTPNSRRILLPLFEVEPPTVLNDGDVSPVGIKGFTALPLDIDDLKDTTKFLRLSRSDWYHQVVMSFSLCTSQEQLHRTRQCYGRLICHEGVEGLLFALAGAMVFEIVWDGGLPPTDTTEGLHHDSRSYSTEMFTDRGRLSPDHFNHSFTEVRGHSLNDRLTNIIAACFTETLTDLLRPALQIDGQGSRVKWLEQCLEWTYRWTLTLEATFSAAYRARRELEQNCQDIAGYNFQQQWPTPGQPFDLRTMVATENCSRRNRDGDTVDSPGVVLLTFGPLVIVSYATAGSSTGAEVHRVLARVKVCHH